MKFTCSSLSGCYREKPEGHCWDCSHALFHGEAKGRGRKLWKFEFNPWRGFLFLNKDETISKVCPNIKSPVWGKLSDFVREINRKGK